MGVPEALILATVTDFAGNTPLKVPPVMVPVTVRLDNTPKEVSEEAVTFEARVDPVNTEAEGVADKTAVFTKAVVATWVVLVPPAAVGAVGIPVKAGELSGAFTLNMNAVSDILSLLDNIEDVSEYFADCPLRA